jgi:hypothetical protein
MRSVMATVLQQALHALEMGALTIRGQSTANFAAYKFSLAFDGCEQSRPKVSSGVKLYRFVVTRSQPVPELRRGPAQRSAA